MIRYRVARYLLHLRLPQLWNLSAAGLEEALEVVCLISLSLEHDVRLGPGNQQAEARETVLRSAESSWTAEEALLKSFGLLLYLEVASSVLVWP